MNTLPFFPNRYFTEENHPREQKLIMAIGLFLLLLALPSNKWVVSSLFSPDGTIESSWFGGLVLVMQSSLIVLSAGLINFRAKTLTKYITVLLISIFLLFCSSLLFDRALSFANYSTKELPQLVYFPNKVKIFKNIEYIYQLKSNSQGIRNNEIPLKKPEESYRVVVIGNSLTEGVGVEAYQTFPSVAQTLFSARGTSKTIEFINCGISSSATLEQARILTYVCMQYEPDAVLVALHPSDVTETDPSTQARDIDLIDSKTGLKGVMYGLWPHIYTAWLEEKIDTYGTNKSDKSSSASFELIASVSQEARQRGIPEEQIITWQNSLPPELVEAANRGQFNREILRRGLLAPNYWRDSLEISSQEAQAKYVAMISLLNEMIRRLDEVNIPVGVVLMPTPLQYDPTSGELLKRLGTQISEEWAVTPTALEKRLETWSEEQHIPYLDLSPIYRQVAKDSPERTLYYRLDGDWTWQGHEVAATEIVQWLANGALSEANTPQQVERDSKMLIKPDPIALAQELTSSSATIPELVVQEAPGTQNHPTLADLWDGKAEFVVEIHETGLPMGESDTIVMSNGDLWSYLHASNRSAGTIDQCGAPVAFPGCTVIYRSFDGGYTFHRDETPVCQFECRQCPCDSKEDHIDQQQYPRVFYNGEELNVVYEYQGRSMRRHSPDGLNWSQPEGLGKTGLWRLWYDSCSAYQLINEHPFAPIDYECIAGGPPGLYVDDNRLYLFVAMGQNPGGMGCFVGQVNSTGDKFQECQNNPLIKGASDYGPLEQTGHESNPYFDFRTISSAEVQKVGECEEAHYYMLYEGIRGPGPGAAGDSQFGLGLARTLSNQIDGTWEKYPNNPLLVDLPGNIGLGHADLVIYKGKTLLYTSLDGVHRSRLGLVWKDNYKLEANNSLPEVGRGLSSCSMRYEFDNLLTQQRSQIGQAFLNLLVGWLMAIFFVPLSFNLLSSIQIEKQLNQRLAAIWGSSLTSLPLRRIAEGLILLFALSKSLDLLNLTNLIEPLQTFLYQLRNLVFYLIEAILLFVLTWQLAKGVKELLRQQKEAMPRAELLGKMIYWLILLAFLPGILDLLLARWLTLQPEVSALITLLPNLLSAVIILRGGYITARFVSQQNLGHHRLIQQGIKALIQLPFVIAALWLIYRNEFNKPTLFIFLFGTLLGLLIQRLMNKRLPRICFKYLNQQQANRTIPMEQPLVSDKLATWKKAEQLAKQLSHICFGLIMTAPILILLVQFPVELGELSYSLNKVSQSLPSLLVISLLLLISYLVAHRIIKLLKQAARQGFFKKLKWDALFKRSKAF